MYSIQITEVFEDWFTGLKDRMVKVRIQARIDRAEDGNFGDSQPVGGGVSEMRLHFGKATLEERCMGTDNNINTLKLKKWDSAAHLGSEADIVAYLQACFEEAPEDAAFLAKALGTVARARGMTQLAKDVGLGRESLYKALSGDNNPSFATMLKVMSALGVKLQVVAA